MVQTLSRVPFQSSSHLRRILRSKVRHSTGDENSRNQRFLGPSTQGWWLQRAEKQHWMADPIPAEGEIISLASIFFKTPLGQVLPHAPSFKIYSRSSKIQPKSFYTTVNDPIDHAAFFKQFYKANSLPGLGF